MIPDGPVQYPLLPTRYPERTSAVDRLWRAPARAETDTLYKAAVTDSPPCWPLPGELGARLRVRYQAHDARTAVTTLALAGILSLNRATLVPWGLGTLVAQLPAPERAQFAGYLDPVAVQVAAILTVLFLATAFVAARRPLVASAVALIGYSLLSAPLVWQNPILVGGGHLGRIVMLLLLLRALFAGLAFRVR